MSVYMIADIGANHDGQYGRMLQAIDQAADAGCEACKFQWVSDPNLMAKRRGEAYANGYAAIYARYLAWPSNWHKELAAYCRGRGIDYMCTVFLPSDIAVIAPHVARFKIASFEATDVALLGAHRQYISATKPLLVSTGMTRWADLAWAYDWKHEDLFLLHCVSSYPAPVNQLTLCVLRMAFSSNESLGARDIGRCPRVCIDFQGFSDHSDPELMWTGALAVAAGARIVEAHLRLDETDPANPDYQHAMTPSQFAQYVKNIRFAEQCLGDGEKRLQACEAVMTRYRVKANDVHE